MNEVELRVMFGRRGPHFCVLLYDSDASRNKPRSLLHCNPTYHVALMEETRLIGAYFGCIYSGRRKTQFSNDELIARTKSLAQTRRFSVLGYNCVDFVDELLHAKKPGRAKYQIAAMFLGLIGVMASAVMLILRAL